MVLLGSKWYWVSIGPLCLYILKKVKIWSDVTIAGQRQTKWKDRATQPLWTMECWDETSAAKHQWGTNHFLRKNMITGHQLWWTWNGRGNSKVEVECWPASWKRLQHIYKVREIKTQRGRLELKTNWYKYSKVQFETPVKKGQLCVCSGWGPFVKDQKGSIMFFFCRDLF